MYKELINSHKYGDMEKFSKLAQSYFDIVYDHEITDTNKRYMIVKISDNNKWKYAGFQKQNGETIKTCLSVNKLEHIDLI